jgi:hypothetical protein
MAIPVLEDAAGRMPGSAAVARILIKSCVATKQLQRASDFAVSIMPLIERHPELSIALAEINGQFGDGPGFMEGCIRRFPAVPEFCLLSAASSEQPLAALRNAIVNCPQAVEVRAALIAAAARQSCPQPRVRGLLERARQA